MNFRAREDVKINTSDATPLRACVTEYYEMIGGNNTYSGLKALIDIIEML